MPIRSMCLLLAAACCLFPGIAAAAPVTAPAAPALLSELDAVMKSHEDLGLAVVVFDRDTRVVAKGYGLANREAGHPVTPDTPFRGGSVGKSVVGAAVMLLVEEGNLSLDDRVADLAPGIAFDNPWEATEPLRLVHLLEHTTGWADLSPHEFALDDPGMDLLAGIREGGVRVSRYPPGRYHAYSGAGHAIAAHIVALRVGMPFDVFVRERLFLPLGMATAGYDEAPGLARSYAPDGSAVPYQHYPLFPSGGLVVSANELATFALMLANGGSVQGRAVLSPDSVLRMETPRTTIAARHGLEPGYGLGLQATVTADAVLHGHGGAIDAFDAQFRYLSGSGRGYAVLANADPVPAELVRVLDAFVAGDAAVPANAPEPATTDVSAFTGTYQPIAHRNRLSPLLDGLTRFVRIEGGQGSITIDGGERILLPGGLLLNPELAAPTQVLVQTDAGHELLGGTYAFRKVAQWTVWAKAAFGAAAVMGLLLALGALAVALWRRRVSWPVVAGLLAYVPLVALVVMLAAAVSLHASASIALFGHPSWLSVGVFAMSLLVPAGAAVALAGAIRGRGVARWSAALATVVLLVAAVHLGMHGWLGLRTWAL